MRKRAIAVLCVLLLLMSILTGCVKNNSSYYGSTDSSSYSSSESVSSSETNSSANSSSSSSEKQSESDSAPDEAEPSESSSDIKLDKNGVYSTKDDVALYLNQYGELPQNYITKSEARKLGWSGGGLDDYAYGKMIGGDRFGNYEKLLPEKSGRKYYECDIDTLHKNSRGAKRIIYSNDGLIYYTGNHYESFELLYGEE